MSDRSSRIEVRNPVLALPAFHRLMALSDAELQMIALFKAPQSFEGSLHSAFRAEHLRGEWYRPSERLLAYAEARGVLPFRKTAKHKPRGPR